MNPVSERTMQDLYVDTVRKMHYLREQGFNVVEMWECDLKRELKDNEEMRSYFEEHDLVDPLEPRDAFFGGRTNAAKLFYECRDQEKIRLVFLRCVEMLRARTKFETVFFVDMWTLPACTPGVTSRHE